MARKSGWIAADDVNRLVREIDVALNGVDAAPQASLCDVTAQVCKAAREGGPILQRLGAPPKLAAAVPLLDRDAGGRIVREAWVRWALAQSDAKPSWLVPYDDLSEADKEADRQIFEACATASPTLRTLPEGWQITRNEVGGICVDGPDGEWLSIDESAPNMGRALMERRLLYGLAEALLSQPQLAQSEKSTSANAEELLAGIGYPTVADALGFSENFAEANPHLTQTAKDHILALCKIIRTIAPAAAQPAAGEVALPEPVVEIYERDDVGVILEWKDGSEAIKGTRHHLYTADRLRAYGDARAAAAFARLEMGWPDSVYEVMRAIDPKWESANHPAQWVAATALAAAHQLLTAQRAEPAAPTEAIPRRRHAVRHGMDLKPCCCDAGKDHAAGAEVYSDQGGPTTGADEHAARRLRQLIGKASFSHGADKDSALELVTRLAGQPAVAVARDGTLIWIETLARGGLAAGSEGGRVQALKKIALVAKESAAGNNAVNVSDATSKGTDSHAVSDTTAALIDMLRKRDATGLINYGKTLDRTDLSQAEWLQHLAEEMLDGAGYALAAIRTLKAGLALAPEIIVRARFESCARGFHSRDYADGYLDALQHVASERQPPPTIQNGES